MYVNHEFNIEMSTFIKTEISVNLPNYVKIWILIKTFPYQFSINVLSVSLFIWKLFMYQDMNEMLFNKLRNGSDFPAFYVFCFVSVFFHTCY